MIDETVRDEMRRAAGAAFRAAKRDGKADADARKAGLLAAAGCALELATDLVVIGDYDAAEMCLEAHDSFAALAARGA